MVVESIAAATTMTVETGSGLDTVVVRSTASTVDAIAGDLRIDGGDPGYALGSASRDRLLVFDTGETADNTGQLTATRLTGFDMAGAGITYLAFEHLGLFLGQRDDTLVIRGTHEGSTLVNAGPRLDRVDVEATMGETRIEGDGGDDFLNVNVRPADPALGDQIGNTANDNISGDDALDLDGGAGSDTYEIRMAGTGSALINVFDTGAPGVGPTGGIDTLTVNGTPDPDLFLLRASKTGSRTAFVALLHGGLYERVNYDENIDGGLTVNGFEGDDRFMVDDNAARTTLNGGVGDDEFQFAQVYETRRDGAAGVAPNDVYATIETTRGYLSNGVTYDTTANGGTGEDVFRVFHNLATLNLNGGFGDDTFLVKAFALVGSQDNLRERDQVDITGDEGADLIQYAVNAPVKINGGEGFDTVIVIGTEFGDDFVITATAVFGGGVSVSYVAVEQLTVDGAEGDDRFYVLGTGTGLTTQLLGGLGSDAVFVGGDVNPVVTNDLLGHSGLIEHVVTSTDPTFGGIDVEGIAANVSDDDEPFVRIIPSGGTTTVVEGQTVALGFDSYQVVLTRRPDRDVVITVAVDAVAPEDAARGVRSVAVSAVPFTSRLFAGSTVGASITITGHGFQNGDRVVYNSGTGGAVGGLVDGTVYVVSVIDANTIQLKPSANGAPITLTGSAGAAQRLMPAESQIQLVFTAANWSVPQTVHVAALDDVAAEGQHFASISHTVLSRDVVIGLVTSAPTATTFVVPAVGVLVGGGSTSLLASDLRGARIEIVRGGAVVRTRIVDAVSSGGGTTVTITVLDAWPAGRTPQPGDEYRITIDDAERGAVSSVPLDTIVAGNVNLGVLGDVEIGQQLVGRWIKVQPAVGAAHWAQILWATSDTLTVAGGFLGAVGPGATFSVVTAAGVDTPYVLVDAAGAPIAAFAANGSPLPNTIVGATVTSVGTSTVVDGLAGLTPGGLVGATIEIVGGTGVGQKRTIIANTATSITVSRPWDIAPTVASAYEIRRYDALVVAAVAVIIEDDDTAGVAIIVTGADTRVTEGAPAGHPGAADTYQVVLTRRPDANVIVTITTDGHTLVRLAGTGTFVASLQVTFTPDDWFVARTIEVAATGTADDSTVEGPQTQVIDHTVTSSPATEGDETAARTDTIASPDGASTVLLSERPVLGSPITVTPDATNRVQVIALAGDVVGGSYFLTFGGERTRRIRFNAEALTIEALLEELVTIGDVTVTSIGPGTFAIDFGTAQATLVAADGAPLLAGVTVTVDGGAPLAPGRFVVEENTLTFRDANGNVEFRTGTFAITYTYAVPGFHQVAAPSIDVRVDDDERIAGRNDVPSVLVFETDGSTDVTEWDTSVNGPAPAWTADTYQIVLSRQPGANVTVASIALPTRTSNGALSTRFVQLVVGGGPVVFTPTNWWIPVTVTVTAVDDDVVDGSDTQAFATRFHTVNGVRGPLLVDGAGGGGSLGLPPVVLLPADGVAPDETNQRQAQGAFVGVSADRTQVTVATADLDALLEHVGRTIEVLDGDPAALFRQIVARVDNAGGTTTFTLSSALPAFGPTVRGFIITRESANFFVDENEQVDSLTLFHDDSVRDEASTITATRITGLGMGGDRTIGGRRQPGGITYGGLEELDVRLGKGADTLTIESTHAGTTRVDLGRGDDTVYVRTTNGHTTLLGGEDDDLVVVASTRPVFGVDLVDFIRGLVTFDGGSGDDRLVVNDAAELDDSTLTVTKSTVSGLDMATVNEVQTVTVRAGRRDVPPRPTAPPRPACWPTTPRRCRCSGARGAGRDRARQRQRAAHRRDGQRRRQHLHRPLPRRPHRHQRGPARRRRHHAHAAGARHGHDPGTGGRPDGDHQHAHQRHPDDGRQRGAGRGARWHDRLVQPRRHGLRQRPRLRRQPRHRPAADDRQRRPDRSRPGRPRPVRSRRRPGRPARGRRNEPSLLDPLRRRLRRCRRAVAAHRWHRPGVRVDARRGHHGRRGRRRDDRHRGGHRHVPAGAGHQRHVAAGHALDGRPHGGDERRRGRGRPPAGAAQLTLRRRHHRRALRRRRRRGVRRLLPGRAARRPRRRRRAALRGPAPGRHHGRRRLADGRHPVLRCRDAGHRPGRRHRRRQRAGHDRRHVDPPRRRQPGHGADGRAGDDLRLLRRRPRRHDPGRLRSPVGRPGRRQGASRPRRRRRPPSPVDQRRGDDDRRHGRDRRPAQHRRPGPHRPGDHHHRAGPRADRVPGQPADRIQPGQLRRRRHRVDGPWRRHDHHRRDPRAGRVEPRRHADAHRHHAEHRRRQRRRDRLAGHDRRVLRAQHAGRRRHRRRCRQHAGARRVRRRGQRHHLERRRRRPPVRRPRPGALRPGRRPRRPVRRRWPRRPDRRRATRPEPRVQRRHHRWQRRHAARRRGARRQRQRPGGRQPRRRHHLRRRQRRHRRRHRAPHRRWRRRHRARRLRPRHVDGRHERSRPPDPPGDDRPDVRWRRSDRGQRRQRPDHRRGRR